jgi:hypothetical protein
MKMTCKIQFDPLVVAPKDIVEAIAAQKLDANVEITFHNSREATAPKVKPAKAGAGA